MSTPAFATNPSAFKASMSAVAAAVTASFSNGQVIKTLETETLVPIDVRPAPRVIPIPHCQSISRHSATESAVSIDWRNPMCSGSIPTLAQAYCIYGPCGFSFSAMRYSCSCVKRLGSLYFANSRAASCAFWLASAARRSASAALASDLLFDSFWRRLAIRANISSAPTPIATRAFASDDPHCSRKESYGGWIAAIATSPITPAITKPPPNHAQRSHDSTDFSNSESLALITPFGRRHAGKRGFVGFWAGLGFGAQAFVILFAIHGFGP